MSRILLLLIFVFWMAAPQYAQPPAPHAWIGVVVFLGYYLLLVLGMGLWGRMLARRVSAGNLRRNLRRYNFTLLIARTMIPVWFAFGVFGLGWGEVVHGALWNDTLRTAQLPGLLLATLPAMAAWMGLWWSQYPAEIALREQNILGALEADMPIYAPPGFRDYFLSNFRLRLLFTVVPIFLIVLLRDLIRVGLRGHTFGLLDDSLDTIAMAASVINVFVFAPEVLRRVLHTERLPDGPLRTRLEAMCRAANIGVRDILLWRTNNNTGNAAVMGILPGMRYVLLSDLLLETMTDEQIEAVFAHEMGHVVHLHMPWMVLFFGTMSLAMGAGQDWLRRVGFTFEVTEWMKPVMVAGGFFWVMLLFGFLSRKFERQADVFAARTMQATLDKTATAESSHVGRYGATLFASALERVAVVNNMPTGPSRRWEGNFRQRFAFVVERVSDLAHNWLHGGIRDRQDYLNRISGAPELTFRFDRFMAFTRATLVFFLAAASMFLWYDNVRDFVSRLLAQI